MVRSPALEVISYLKKTDDRNPAVRYLFCILKIRNLTPVFYPHDDNIFGYLDILGQMAWRALGRQCLSVMSCTSVIHRDGWCCTFLTVRWYNDIKSPFMPCQYCCIVCLSSSVLYLYPAHIWVKNCKELLPSSYNKARFDQPLEANNWLRNFKTTNENVLSKVAIVLHLEVAFPDYQLSGDAYFLRGKKVTFYQL